MLTYTYKHINYKHPCHGLLRCHIAHGDLQLHQFDDIFPVFHSELIHLMAAAAVVPGSRWGTP